MSERTIPDNESSKHQESGHYAVILPCEPKDFGEFVTGLLGKPQTIEKSLDGIFEISHDDVINMFHLVDQRINQQNEAIFIQFNVRITYNDDSSILLNSLQDFDHYTEVRPLESVGVTLSWAYLIKFKNKKVPEKQEIDLTFRAGDNSDDISFLDDIIIRRFRRYSPLGIFIRINHTERTWGIDIESLLTGQVKTLFKKQNKFGMLIYKKSDLIGLISGCLFFLSTVIAILWAKSDRINNYVDNYRSDLIKLSESSTTKIELIGVKLDLFIENSLSRLSSPLISNYLPLYVFMSIFLAISIGIWIGFTANNRPHSFVLLSKAAEQKQNELSRKRRRDWVLFGISILFSIITGVISNLIFTTYIAGSS